MHKTTNKQSGTSLIEVLVALVVMSVGLLGIAGLYVTTLQAKTTSLSRMKAVNLAYDIGDRIRANPTAYSSYLIAKTDTTTSTDCATTNCTPQQMAASDLYQWDALINDTTNGTGLPGGTAVKRKIVETTAKTDTNPEVLTVTLTWREVTSGSNDLTYSLQVRI